MDTINTTANTTIRGESGADSITNSGPNVTINALAGNDYINNSGPVVSISGGSGADLIYNNGSYATINAGTGDNIITNSANYVLFQYGGGLDTIDGFNSTSTLQISGSDSISEAISDGMNATLVVDGGSSNVLKNIMLKNLGSLSQINISVNGGLSTQTFSPPRFTEWGDYRFNTFSGSSLSALSLSALGGNDTIINSGDFVSIGGGSGNDSIINYGSSVTIDGGEGNDRIFIKGDNVSINTGDGQNIVSVQSSSLFSIFGGSGKDSIYVNKYGLSGTINAERGNDTIRVSQSEGLSIDGGEDDDLIYFVGSANRNNLIQYKAGEGTDSIYNFGSSDTLSISGSSSISFSMNGDALVLDVTGTAGASSGKVIIYDATWIPILNIVGDNGSISDTSLINNETRSTLTVNAEDGIKNILAIGRMYSTNIKGNDKDNLIIGGRGADTLHGNSGNDTLIGGAGIDLFLYSAGKDVITDYGNGSDRISLASGVKISDVSIENKNADVPTENKNDVVLSMGGDSTLTIINGYKLLNSKGTPSNKDNKITFREGTSLKTYIFDEHKIFNSNKTEMTLTGTEQSGSIDASKEYSKLKTIDASNISSPIYIKGNTKANFISGGSSGSTLYGNKGNDTLVGGGGNDIFVYKKGEGKDVILNYGKGDSISIVGGEISEVSSLSNKDVTFKIGSKKITVKSAVNETINIMYNDNNGMSLYGGVLYKGGSASLISNFSTKTTSTIGAETIDGSTSKKSLNISGGSSTGIIFGSKKNDTIFGGSDAKSIVGGAGNDRLYSNGSIQSPSLWGGKGNDTLYGGTGVDTFIYGSGEGKDVIVGFGSNDILKITKGTVGKTTYNKRKNEVTMKISSGSVTFKEIATTSFQVQTGGNTTDTYTISDGVISIQSGNS